MPLHCTRQIIIIIIIIIITVVVIILSLPTISLPSLSLLHCVGSPVYLLFTSALAVVYLLYVCIVHRGTVLLSTSTAVIILAVN